MSSQTVIIEATPGTLVLTDRQSDIIDNARELFADGYADGESVGEASQGINDVASALSGMLIWNSGFSGGIAVYLLADGDYMLVGDAHGPWGVRVAA